MIPKADGKQRPLGIPTSKDRVVQMAAAIVLEAIFEADLPDEQFGYRPERSAHGAVKRIHAWLQQGMTEVEDADLSGYFDTIPHPELMPCLARGISDATIFCLGSVSGAYRDVDNHVRHRLRQWLNRKHHSQHRKPCRYSILYLYHQELIIGIFNGVLFVGCCVAPQS